MMNERMKELALQADLIWHKSAPINIKIEKFAELIIQDCIEKVAQWMIRQGYVTGHGDNIEDLLTELEWQIEDRIRNIIRARGNT